MNRTSPPNDLRSAPAQGNREVNLDRLLSDYFKSKMKQPWPAAPSTSARMPLAEPSVLAASRTPSDASVEAPRNHPVTAGSQRDNGNKSRYTLAVSVAVLIGTCWGLSNGFQPGERTGSGGNAPVKLNVFQDAGASDPAALKELHKDKAENGNQGVAQPKIQLP